MARVVCGGGLRIDYVITREGQAHVGLPGGNALYAASGARLWADRVAIWARYGRNYPSSWLEQLEVMGLDTGGLVALPQEQDHRTFFAYTEGGERDDTEPARHFARIGQPLPAALAGYIHSTPRQDDPTAYEPLALRPDDWPEKGQEMAAVHLAPLPLATHLHVPAALRAAGVGLISVDPGERYMIPARRDEIRALLGQIDVFLPSDQEVRSLFGPTADLWQAAEQLLAWGAPLVVIKAGAAGVLIAGGEGALRQEMQAYHAPGDPRVIDVTGAGDAFCGGFLAGLAETEDAIEAARRGLVASSLVIECYGALAALTIDRVDAQQRLAELTVRSDV